MYYLATSIREAEPILIVEAGDVEQATSRVKGAMHSLGLDASQKFDCKEIAVEVEVAAVPVFHEDFFQLLGFVRKIHTRKSKGA